MKKHRYYVDGFSGIYEKLSDLRNHIESLSVMDAMSYDGEVIVRDGEAYRQIDIRSYTFPRRIVIFKKLEDPLKGWT